MKKAIITILFTVLVCAVCQAQRPAATPVSKKDFEASVSKLKISITQNSPQEAKKQWEQVHEQMLSEFALLKSKIMAATNANDEIAKTRYWNVYNQQLALYREIFNAKDALIPYRQQLFDRFASYANTML